MPLDCGKMAPPLYPQVYRLLVVLGATADIGLRLFEPYLWRGVTREAARLERFPRIRFGDCILRRRGWSIPRDALPQPQPHERPWTYFLRVRRWQRTHGLPEEVFVRATSLLEWKDQAVRRQDRQTWNRRKPQYIHFRNGFLVDALGRIVEETQTRLYVEEMLPDRASWRYAGLHRPVEWVLDLGWRRDLRSASEQNHGAHDTSGDAHILDLAPGLLLSGLQR